MTVRRRSTRRLATLGVVLGVLMTLFAPHAASGAVTSGIGYVIWYAALNGLSAMRAATVQLSVPPIAAFGGVLLLSESVSIRLVLASIAILGGVAMVLASKSRRPVPRRST